MLNHICVFSFVFAAMKLLLIFCCISLDWHPLFQMPSPAVSFRVNRTDWLFASRAVVRRLDFGLWWISPMLAEEAVPLNLLEKLLSR
jgi:hypothetical protein